MDVQQHTDQKQEKHEIVITLFSTLHGRIDEIVAAYQKLVKNSVEVGQSGGCVDQ